MWPIANPEIFNARQKKIRDFEWSSIERYIVPYSGGKFLDVGAGTGYALARAKLMGFQVVGCDPEVGLRGVCDDSNPAQRIVEAIGEELPFQTGYFDVVYSSHSLEHFQDRDKGLKEINRVVRPEGLVVIAVPTGIMALISFLSQLVFASHIRIGRFLCKDFSLLNFKRIFFPQAHGAMAKSIAHETIDFAVEKWERQISINFNVCHTLLPSIYPYPDFPQFFPFYKSKLFSSSAIFICKKKDV